MSRPLPVLRRSVSLPGFLLLALPALLASCAHAPDRPRAPSDPAYTYVDRDTRWEGEVRVDGIVVVRKGATLTLAPGTTVRFAAIKFAVRGDEEHEGFNAPGIKVEGKFLAAGTEEAPVRFAPANPSGGPGSWDKILFVFSGGNVFSHCVFEGARYGIHAHFSEVEVTRCLFRGNEEGVRLGVSKVRIADSVFTANLVRGINFRECRNEIEGNLVYGNGDGIFLHSKNSASTVRGNAVYGNRGYDLRLGDLHAEDVDVSGNWWGTADGAQVRARVYDGEDLEGLGRAKTDPVLPRPPVGGATIRGVFTSHMQPVAGAEVRAYPSVAAGFWEEGYARSAVTEESGLFSLDLPPGRYFVIGRAESSAGLLFAFPGRNPVPVSLGGTAEVGMPAVVAPPREVREERGDGRPRVAARVTRDGQLQPGVTVQAFRAPAADFRGPGDASAVTGEQGTATLSLPPGRYFLAAKKRTGEMPLGMVEEGGLFGVYPYSPVDLAQGVTLHVEIPMFEKRGILGEEEGDAAGAAAAAPDGGIRVAGTATLAGNPAEGHIVFFYRAGELIGRPLARSSPVSRSGAFSATLPGLGEYAAFLRKSIPGLPAGAEEDRVGPVPVTVREDGIFPAVLSF